VKAACGTECRWPPTVDSQQDGRLLCSGRVEQKARKVGTWESLGAVFRSRRLGSVALLSFASGLPLGLVWLAVPAWMTSIGVDIKVVGLFTLAQAPWSFKVLWAPLVDRYPLPFLGRKRGWILVTQVLLLGLALGFAAASEPPVSVGLIGALCLATALASATFDIAYDGYSVEVLRKEEHGVAGGGRMAVYRVAMWVSGRLGISLSAIWGWATVHLGLALLYVPTMIASWLAPEPEEVGAPPLTLREAVWEPFVGLLAQHRALEILAFVVLYKLSDNLTQALTGPFLVKVGFSLWDVGIGAGTVGTLAFIAGAVLGGLLSTARGLGPALWICGFLQIFSNLGYAAVAQIGVNRPVMYSAQAFEYLTTGMGSGAFGALLLRLTDKRFSATQFALLTSLFTIPRVLAGPPAGLLADAIGWRDFFILTLFTGIPGMVMLARFVPWGVREPEFSVAPSAAGGPLSRRALAGWSAAVGVLTTGLGLVTMALLAAIRNYRNQKGFDLGAQLLRLLECGGWGEILTVLGVVVVGAVTALMAAAALVARRGGGSGGGAPAYNS
jgi:MFS transporter, PAT family, beta-lactamase induction signal transducer AmpG